MQALLARVVAPFRSALLFFVLYVVFLVPTYLLPYAGSNSAFVNALGAAAGIGMSPQFWAHVACLFALVSFTWLRGCSVNKQWIAIFPAIAGIFDLTPGLSLVPLLPTVMHVLALVMGVRGSKELPEQVNVPVFGALLMATGGGIVVSGLLYSWTWQSRIQSTDMRMNSSASASTNRAVEGQTRQPNQPTSGGNNTLQGRALFGHWNDSGSTCAFTSRGSNDAEIDVRIWYCEDEATAQLLTLSRKMAVGKFVHAASGLTVVFRPDGKLEISAPAKSRRSLFGQDGFDFMSDVMLLSPKNGSVRPSY